MDDEMDRNMTETLIGSGANGIAYKCALLQLGHILNQTVYKENVHF